MKLLLLPVRIATKKITSILFILLGFVPMLFVLVFVLRQQSVRHRMKERLEQEMLHTITIADEEVHWTEKGKELLVHGKMFDVKSIEQSNGFTTLRGLYDDEETLLNKTFGEAWKSRSSQQKQLLAQLFQCLRGFYFSSTPDLQLAIQQQQQFMIVPSSELTDQFKAILTPPPRA